MASVRLAALLLFAGSWMIVAPADAAPVPLGNPAAGPDALITPVCHRGWHHRSGRPCGYGYGYGYGYRHAPPAFGYGRRPLYGYRSQRCHWHHDLWGRPVRVCRW